MKLSKPRIARVWPGDPSIEKPEAQLRRLTDMVMTREDIAGVLSNEAFAAENHLSVLLSRLLDGGVADFVFRRCTGAVVGRGCRRNDGPDIVHAIEVHRVRQMVVPEGHRVHARVFRHRDHESARLARADDGSFARFGPCPDMRYPRIEFADIGCPRNWFAIAIQLVSLDRRRTSSLHVEGRHANGVAFGDPGVKFMRGLRFVDGLDHDGAAGFQEAFLNGLLIAAGSGNGDTADGAGHDCFLRDSGGVVGELGNRAGRIGSRARDGADTQGKTHVFGLAVRQPRGISGRAARTAVGAGRDLRQRARARFLARLLPRSVRSV